MMYGGKLVGFFLLFCSASPSRVDVCRFFSLAPVFFGTGDLWICLGYRVYILDSCHVVSKLIFTFFSWAPHRSHKLSFSSSSSLFQQKLYFCGVAKPFVNAEIRFRCRTFFSWGRKPNL